MRKFNSPFTYCLLALLLLLVPGAMAIDCVVNQNPIVLSKRPTAICTLNDSANTGCYTYLSNPANSSEIWGGMPKRELVTGVGAVDVYPVVNNVVTVQFSRSRLLENHSITGNIVCGTESHSFNFTPIFADWQEVAEASIYVRDNAQWLIMGFFLLIIVIIVLVGVIRAAKN